MKKDRNRLSNRFVSQFDEKAYDDVVVSGFSYRPSSGSQTQDNCDWLFSESTEGQKVTSKIDKMCGSMAVS